MYNLYDELRGASFEQILKQSEELLFLFSSVNRPMGTRGRRVLPVQSAISVCARPDGTMSFNFASRAVQAMMLDAVPEAEALCDELGRKMQLNRAHGRKGRETFGKLGSEVVIFLEGLRTTGPLDTDEIRDLTLESVRSPLLPALL